MTITMLTVPTKHKAFEPPVILVGWSQDKLWRVILASLVHSDSWRINDCLRFWVLLNAVVWEWLSWWTYVNPSVHTRWNQLTVCTLPLFFPMRVVNFPSLQVPAPPCRIQFCMIGMITRRNLLVKKYLWWIFFPHNLTVYLWGEFHQPHCNVVTWLSP